MDLLCITDVATHPPFDTTVELYRRLAQDERFTFWHSTPQLVMVSTAARVDCQSVPTFSDFQEFQSLTGTGSLLGWSDFDLVFCRTDKPFIDGYHDRLHKFSDLVPFVNAPVGCKTTSRKAFLERFFHLMPDSASIADIAEAIVFCKRHLSVVLKLDNSYGGRGIVRMCQQGDTIECSALDKPDFTAPDWEQALAPYFPTELPIQFVRYLRQAPLHGDKRVLVVGGEIYGGYVRKGKAGSWIHNISAGGTAHVSEVTPVEEKAIRETWPHYSEHGMSTLGYDFLMDDNDQWILSEINAGNIGGYGRLEELSGKPVFNRLLDFLYSMKS